MVALNQPEPPPIGRLAPFLAMDASTLTAAAKPLARRGLLRLVPDTEDRRSRRVRITPEGVALLLEAIPVWRVTHAALDAQSGPGTTDALRQGFARIG
nr:MarR family transcriptional regulator [Elioraea sp.]